MDRRRGPGLDQLGPQRAGRVGQVLPRLFPCRLRDRLVGGVAQVRHQHPDTAAGLLVPADGLHGQPDLRHGQGAVGVQVRQRGAGEGAWVVGEPLLVDDNHSGAGGSGPLVHHLEQLGEPGRRASTGSTAGRLVLAAGGRLVLVASRRGGGEEYVHRPGFVPGGPCGGLPRRPGRAPPAKSAVWFADAVAAARTCRAASAGAYRSRLGAVSISSCPNPSMVTATMSAHALTPSWADITRARDRHRSRSPVSTSVPVCSRFSSHALVASEPMCTSVGNGAIASTMDGSAPASSASRPAGNVHTTPSATASPAASLEPPRVSAPASSSVAGRQGAGRSGRLAQVHGDLASVQPHRRHVQDGHVGGRDPPEHLVDSGHLVGGRGAGGDNGPLQRDQRLRRRGDGPAGPPVAELLAADQHQRARDPRRQHGAAGHVTRHGGEIRFLRSLRLAHDRRWPARAGLPVSTPGPERTGGTVDGATGTWPASTGLAGSCSRFSPAGPCR